MKENYYINYNNGLVFLYSGENLVCIEGKYETDYFTVYINSKGQLHREDGPAHITDKNGEYWLYEGELIK